MDRWGGMVFQNKDFLPNSTDGGWNGDRQGQKMPTGVYVYFVQIKMTDGSIVKKMGEVSLLY